MIDESWDKLENKSISLDELESLKEALLHFSDVNTTDELLAIDLEKKRLLADPRLAKKAEKKSTLYDKMKMIQNAESQENPEDIQSEAECISDEETGKKKKRKKKKV